MTAPRRRIKAAGLAGKYGAAAWGWRRVKALFAWSAIAIVAFNSLALLVLPVAPQFPMALPDAVNGRIVICTAAGLVTINTDGQPASDETSHAGVCANCLPLLAATVSAPAAGILAVLVPTPPAPCREENAPHVVAFHRPSARAPPVV